MHPFQTEKIKYIQPKKIKVGYKVYLNNCWWKVLSIKISPHNPDNEYLIDAEAYGKGYVKNIVLNKNVIYTTKTF